MPSRRSPLSAGRSRRRSNSTRTVGTVILLLLIVAIISVPAVIHFATKTSATFTVTDKNIKYVRDSDGKNGHDEYLIYTDHGTFKDVDSIFAWKFNSSDLYGKLKVGQTYKCSVAGFRVGFASSYKNLLGCEVAK